VLRSISGAGVTPRLERRPGREALDRCIAQIVEADPAQPALIPHEPAWLDDQQRHIEARRQTDGGGCIRSDVGFEQGDMHGRSDPQADHFRDIMRLCVTVLARCARLF
jgi:hypothetical protein